MSYVVDASLAVKWLVREPLRDAAMTLIDPGVSLHAPSLILADVANALCKKVQQGEVSAAHAHQARREITSYFDELWPLDDLAERAMDIAVQTHLSLSDCFYLACSEELGLPLVTADIHLLRIVRTTSFAAQIVNIVSIAPAKA